MQTNSVHLRIELSMIIIIIIIIINIIIIIIIIIIVWTFLVQLSSFKDFHESHEY